MRRVLKGLGLALPIALALALAGCGGSGGHASAGATTSRAAPPSHTASPSPSPTVQALNPATLVGKTLFGLDDSDAVCQMALDGTSAPDQTVPLPVPGGTGIGDNSDEDTGSAVASGTGTLTPGGLLVLSCYASATASSPTLVAFNLFSRTIAWQFDTTPYDSYTYGTSHLFLISHHTQPASGLQSASTKYTLTAVDLATGATDWSVPYITDNPHSEGQGIDGLTEGPSGIAAHPQAVVVTYLGTSAYDAATGASLWHIKTEYDTLASGSYTLDGVVETYGYQDNYYDSHITGFDVRTGRKVWDLRLKTPCTADTGAQDDVFQGLVEWEFSDGCAQAHNIATGALVLDKKYPSSWKSVAATPKAVVEYGKHHLAYYAMPNLTSPVWSEHAGSTTPLVVSSGHILVDAPSGLVVVSAADGSVTTSVPDALFPSGDYTYVNGLVVQTAEDGESSVLELDPPR
jgi:hypothetical protein